MYDENGYFDPNEDMEIEQETGSRGGPDWYMAYGTKRCDCEPKNHRTIREHYGYSDFGYFLEECRTCKQKWTWYIEG